MSEVRVNNLSNENNTGGPTISGITTYSGRHFFVPPQGDTASRPSGCPPGSLRFNTDSTKLEYYRGDTIGWVEIEAGSEELGGGTGSNLGLGNRGLYMGGNRGSHPSGVDNIDYITISTAGNSQDFGDMHSAVNQTSAFGSRKRAVSCGGNTPSDTYGNSDTYMTIFASLGNASDFYTLTATSKESTAYSNDIRGFYQEPQVKQITYVNIESGGNFQDFGSLIKNTEQGSSFTSSTRAVIVNASDTPSMTNSAEFITMMTTGNGTDFGDTTAARYGAAGGSNATRGVVAGGYYPAVLNIIDFCTIATTGNFKDFGDLTEAKYGLMGGSACSKTRMLVMGGYTSTHVNTIESLEFATQANAVDFGDLTSVVSGGGVCSNGHGGL
mgnify:CR=1 FL=1